MLQEGFVIQFEKKTTYNLLNFDCIRRWFKECFKKNIAFASFSQILSTTSCTQTPMLHFFFKTQHKRQSGGAELALLHRGLRSFLSRCDRVSFVSASGYYGGHKRKRSRKKWKDSVCKEKRSGDAEKNAQHEMKERILVAGFKWGLLRRRCALIFRIWRENIIFECDMMKMCAEFAFDSQNFGKVSLR